MKELIRKVKFHDKNWKLWNIKAEITYRNWYPEFTMSWDSGQCQDSIEPLWEYQEELLSVWQEYHLNGMNAGTKKQDAILKKRTNEKWNDLPSDFDKTIEALCSNIEQEDAENYPVKITEDMKNESFILVKAEELWIWVNKLLAMCINCDVSTSWLSYIDKWYKDNIFYIEWNEYLVCTDKEADKECADEIKESAWAFNPDFIIDHSKALDHDDWSYDILKAIQEKCEWWNAAVIRLIDDFDEFVEDAITADWRWHFLNRRNWDEDEVKVNGENFYLYKQC